MKKIFALINAFLLSAVALPQVTFQKSFEGGTGYGVTSMPDSGFVVIGERYDPITSNPQLLLFRFNEQGDTMWTKKFESNSSAYEFSGFSVKSLYDGGLIISGTLMDSVSSFGDACLIRTDSNGNIIWSRAYRDTLNAFSSDAVSCVEPTNDNGFIVGYSGYGSGTNVFKTDSMGTIEWSNYFLELDHIQGGDFVKPTPDGGYVLTGNITYAGAGPPYSNIELVRLSANGILLWIKTWGTPSFEYGTSVLVTDDSCYLTTGIYPVNNRSGCLLTKTDSSGLAVWSHTYGVSNSDISIYSAEQTIDGGYILCGDIEIQGGYPDIFILKTQSNGTVSWSKSIGSQGSEFSYAINQMPDGGYILTGSDEWKGLTVIKTDNSGNSGCNEFALSTNMSSQPTVMTPDSFTTHSALITYVPNINSLSGINDTTLCINFGTAVREIDLNEHMNIYPNPVTGNSIVSIELKNVEQVSIILYDMAGKLIDNIFTGQLQSGKHELHLPDIPKGIFVIKIQKGNQFAVRKLIVH